MAALGAGVPHFEMRHSAVRGELRKNAGDKPWFFRSRSGAGDGASERVINRSDEMRFPGHWVYEHNGKVVLEQGVFDDTDLDPDTNWQQAWQNQDPESPAKGYLVESEAVACAARLLAGIQAIELSDADIIEIQTRPSFYQDDKCEIGTLDELRLFAAALNLRDGLLRSFDKAGAPGPARDSAATDELPDLA